MRSLLTRWAVLVLAVLLTTVLVEGLTVNGGALGYVLFAAAIGLVNALVRPLVRLLALPVRLATLGLASLVIDGLLLVGTAWATDIVEIDGVVTAITATLALSILATVLNWALVDRARKS